MDRHHQNFIDRHPYPDADPVQRLRHTVSVFANSAAGELAVMATSGIYPAEATIDNRKEGWTGLTHGDLRHLLTLVEHQ